MVDADDDDERAGSGRAGGADDGFRGGAGPARRATGLSEATTALAARLRALVADRYATTDGSHDLAHLDRVWASAQAIAAEVPCDADVLAAACWLHDCIAVEKNSPDRARASRLAADEAARVLTAWNWPPARVAAVHHAIVAHSFAAGVPPETAEAAVLRDADRLDALGAIGIARTFYVAGRMGARLYDPTDPPAIARELDDASFALDHFSTKLFRLADGMLTAPGRGEAERRAAFMRDFVARLLAEAG